MSGPFDELAGPDECGDALHELYRLLDGELDAERRVRILAHLERCQPCASPYDFYGELRRVVANCCRDQAPPELMAKVQAALRSERAGGR